MKQSHKILVASLIAVAGTALTVTAVNAAPRINAVMRDSSVVAAVKAGDLDGFKKAAKTAADAQINATTQDQLNTMKARQDTRQAVQDAIKDNNFVAYQKATANDKHRIGITQAQFDKIVTRYNAKAAVEAKLTTAAKANDKAAFTTVLTEWHTAQDANRPARTDASGNVVTRPALTQAHIDEEWTKALADVTAGNSVTLGGDKMGRHRFGGGMGGHRGHGSMMNNGTKTDMPMHSEGVDPVDQLNG